jgi:hypothetical protein
MRSKLALLLALCVLTVVGSKGGEKGAAAIAESNCIKLDNPLRGGGERFEIGQPGRYCLGKNMSTRLDLPDRREQSFLISIYADNVDLDLNGHTLDRGWNISGEGKPGILISSSLVSGPGAKNITIRNGTVRGLGSGVAGRLDCKSTTNCDKARITYDPTSDTYHYAPDNITVQNVKFENVKHKIVFSDGRGHTVAVDGDRR